MLRKLKLDDRRIRVCLSITAITLALGNLAILDAPAQTAGALANGLSAAAVGRGGVNAPASGDPMDAIQGNPAGLSGIRKPVLDVGGVGLLASGSFRNSVDPNGRLNGVAGALPYAAFAMPLGNSRWVAAVGVTPDALMRVNWRYIDPPGTAGVSYGVQENKAEIYAIRSSAGLACALGPKWTLGATVGLVYNRNTLKAPYIFQEQPQLAGLKVLLDLETSGLGWNGSAGAQWQPVTRLRLGAAWKSATYVQSHGSASGSASALFNALGITADPAFHYQAEVDNHFPQTLAAGASWQTNPKLRLDFEGDWTNWGGAFQQLPVKLAQGSNAVINSVVGSDAMVDEVPLHWHDQGVAKVGAEISLAPAWTARGGYSYMSDPVPSATLTPLTAAILRNSLAAGIGWNKDRWHWDAAYQAQLPASASVEQSSLLAGEYDNSHVRLMAQSLTVTARVDF